MKILTTSLRREPSFAPLADALRLESRPVLAKGLCDTLAPVMCAAIIEELKAKTLLIFPDENKAREMCGRLSGKFRVLYYPARDFRLTSAEASSREFSYARLSVLSKIMSGDFDIVVTTVEAASQQTLPRTTMKSAVVCLDISTKIGLEAIEEKLESLGYRRAEKVEGAGQYSVRGGIIDVFLPSEDEPVRIELFGDEIDSMSYFDVLTQRRTEKTESVTLIPAAEIYFGPKERETVSGLLLAQKKHLKPNETKKREFIESELGKLERGEETAFDLYSCDVYGEETLFDYATELFYIVFEPDRLKLSLNACEELLHETIKNIFEDNKTYLPASADKLIGSFGLFCDLISGSRALLIESFSSGREAIEPSGIFTFNSRQTPPTGNNAQVLCQLISEYLESGYKTVFVCENTLAAQNLYSYLYDNGIGAVLAAADEDISMLDKKTVYITVGMKSDERVISLSGGYELMATKFAVLTDSGSAPKSNAARSFTGRKASAREKIVSYADLKEGDYIVHENFGIGIYKGIEKIKRDGVMKDFIKIAYAGTDVLYVPCSNLDSVSKYIGARSESGTVKLNHMDGTEWNKAKSRAKSAVKDIAKQLIALYSQRLKTKGHAFSPDTEWQKEFEGAFEYNETEGQLRSGEEIKSDMEKPSPMDRLLCGDVGFGKTEVALRAVFKCVMDGLQAAILVPTTILAWQHYQTALARFRGYPVSISMLSRFVTKKDQEKTVKQLKSGEVDIIIGTHRLLQKDIDFARLGLVVIDEEQRFGVTHKERLKDLVKSVDVLTLTATPIPRTLNMALGGIKDMSVLEEAPNDRFPVQTYVFEYDEALIGEAIRKELRRGGQVLYLYNNIEAHQSRVARIEKAFPEARVKSASGQMDKELLSDIWREMTEGNIDVLVCTTIIETGVDLPNANTLIIEDCDRYGLSQLHQIRGRVGRSDRKAYAYLTYRRGQMLSEIATKRLMAIKEYTEFGSGFKLALRDLEIRGAGNLLGAQQSGHIDTVGYDLYMRLLNEAVLEEKGEYVAPKDESTIDLTVDAYIPEKYVESSKMRIDIYKKIAACENDDDLSDLTDELIDRFGDIPRPVDNLFRVSKIKRMAQNVHIKKITQQEQIITFILGAAPDIEAVMLLKPVYTSRLNIELDEKPRFSLRLSHAAASNSTLPGGIAGSVSPSQLSLDTTDEVLAHLEGFSKK